jgi:hypothetical protein
MDLVTKIKYFSDILSPMFVGKNLIYSWYFEDNFSIVVARIITCIKTPESLLKVKVAEGWEVELKNKIQEVIEGSELEDL